MNQFEPQVITIEISTVLRLLSPPVSITTHALHYPMLLYQFLVPSLAAAFKSAMKLEY